MKFVPILTVVEKAVQDGLREAAKAVLKESNELAPKDDGDLVKSGAVRVDDLTAQVSYTAFHARFQHENLDYVHDDGQPKFLEAATQKVDVPEIIATRVRRALSG